MPKETFLKLSNEKQQKVINSAKKEFARVPIQEVSIKNIVEDAGIARGSFYQYFESKEDLLIYIIRENVEKLNNKLNEEIQKKNGNLFEIYISIYDNMVENFVEQDESKLFKQIFENIKSSDESIFKILKENDKRMEIADYYESIDKTNLRIKNEREFKIVCRMLDVITRNAVIKNFKKDAKEENRKEFLKKIDYLKYGIVKEEKDV